MPTDPTISEPAAATAPDPACRRILRMTLGTALGMAVSQMVMWPLSFVAPLLAFVLLSLPLTRLTIKMALGFVFALSLFSFTGLLLVPFLDHARWAGIALFALALFYSFYLPARGGSPVVGTFMTLGLTLVAAIGTKSSALLLQLAGALTLNAALAMLFVFLAHALLPDPLVDAQPGAKPPPAPPDLDTSRLRALRSMLIVLPIAMIIMFSSSGASYLIVMIKVATMGQQANVQSSRNIGRSLLASTVIGGVGALLVWQLLEVWPSLLLYTLLLALTLLLFGRKIFQGTEMHPNGSTWSYGVLTMIVILAPAVTDGLGSDGASAAFYTRLFLFLVIALYGSAAVAVFDAFLPQVIQRSRSMPVSSAPA